MVLINLENRSFQKRHDAFLLDFEFRHIHATAGIAVGVKHQDSATDDTTGSSWTIKAIGIGVQAHQFSTAVVRSLDLIRRGVLDVIFRSVVTMGGVEEHKCAVQGADEVGCLNKRAIKLRIAVKDLVVMADGSDTVAFIDTLKADGSRLAGGVTVAARTTGALGATIHLIHHEEGAIDRIKVAAGVDGTALGIGAGKWLIKGFVRAGDVLGSGNANAVVGGIRQKTRVIHDKRIACLKVVHIRRPNVGLVGVDPLARGGEEVVLDICPRAVMRIGAVSSLDVLAVAASCESVPLVSSRVKNDCWVGEVPVTQGLSWGGQSGQGGHGQGRNGRKESSELHDLW